MGEFAYPFGSRYSDLVISHYPNFIFLKTSLLNDRQIPLWSNIILSGFPFAANPLAGMWYLPTWLAVFIPAPYGINFLIILHLIFGGSGMYLFLRSQRLDFWAAVVGALSFVLMPKLFAHFAAGHITLVFAVCWTPWLLLAEKNRAIRAGRLQKILPGIVLGEIFLADPRWVVYAGGLWLLFAFKMCIEKGIQLGEKAGLSLAGSRLKKSILEIGVQAVVALFIAAPLLLPLMQYSGLSTRSKMTTSDNLLLSLDFPRLLGLAIPDMAGYAEYMIYPGSILLIALFWTIFHREARRENRFWLLVVLFSVIYSLGEHIPLMTILARLPGMSLLRVPSRALFLTGFALPVICANTIQLIYSKRVTGESGGGAYNVFLVGFAGFLIMATVGIWFLSDSLPLEFLWGAVAVLCAVLFLILYEKEKITSFIALCGLVVVLCLDLGGVDASQMAYRELSEVNEEKAELINAFSNNTEPFRIYSPSYSVPQQMAALNELELADGIDPLQLMSYVEFMETATGVPGNSYSVTMPPFLSGDPIYDNQYVKPDIEVLSLLNVKYIVAEFPVSLDGLRFLKRYGQTWLYENTKTLPRAWIQENETQWVGQRIRPVEILERKSNHIVIAAEGPGLLVLSEINYPGWRVYVDGQPAEMETPFGLLRAVSLDFGFHTVKFEFKPFTVYLGVILKLLGLSVILVLLRSDFHAVEYI